jgi:hypothetical protein
MQHIGLEKDRLAVIGDSPRASGQGGTGEGGCKRSEPPRTSPPKWISQVQWCPSCLVVLHLGLRSIPPGGCCPSCGEYWETAADVPAVAFDALARPCVRWHFQPCKPCAARFAIRRRRQGGGR